VRRFYNVSAALGLCADMTMGIQQQTSLGGVWEGRRGKARGADRHWEEPTYVNKTA